jgi:hypothetical protein
LDAAFLALEIGPLDRSPVAGETGPPQSGLKE